jgi:hypothetical protein
MKSATQSQDRKAPEREGQKESHFHDMRTDSNGVEGDGSAAMTNAGVVHEPWWLGGLFVSTGVSVHELCPVSRLRLMRQKSD